MRLVAGVTAIPGNIADGVAASILVAQTAGAAACSIFPLGLGRQAVMLARLLIEFGNEQLAVLPRDVIDRQLQIAREGARVAAHDVLPQLLSHLNIGNLEVVQRDTMNRLLPGIGIGALFFGAAHLESAATDVYHLECCAIDILRLIGACRLVDGNRDGLCLLRHIVEHSDNGVSCLESRQQQFLAADHIAGDTVHAAGDGVAAAAVEDGNGAVVTHLHPDSLAREGEVIRIRIFKGNAQARQGITEAARRACRHTAVGGSAAPASTTHNVLLTRHGSCGV